jgi:beta-mannosidase
LGLSDSTAKSISENFYWLNGPGRGDHFAALNTMPAVELDPSLGRVDKDGTSTITVTLHNPSPNIALMVHLQLRRQTDNTRVLPVFYSGNYVSMVGVEDKTIEIQCATDSLKGEPGLVVVDGWNVTVKSATAPGVAIELNENAQVDHWPRAGLPLINDQ